MAIVKSYNKKQDVTYVYEQTTYTDPETGRKSLKRHVIGRIDPATGEVVPTRKRDGSSGRTLTDAVDSEYKGIVEKQKLELKQKEKEIVKLNADLKESKKTIRKLEDKLKSIRRLTE